MKRFSFVFAIALVASACQTRALSHRPLGIGARDEAGCGGRESLHRTVGPGGDGGGGCAAGAPRVSLGTGIYSLTVGRDGPRGNVNVTSARTGRPLGVELDLPGFASTPSFNQPLGGEGWTIGIAPDPSGRRSPRYTLVVNASADTASGPRELDFCVHAASSAGERVGCSMTWLRAWDEVAALP